MEHKFLSCIQFRRGEKYGDIINPLLFNLVKYYVVI